MQDAGKPAVERFVGGDFVQIAPTDKPHFACVTHNIITAKERGGGHAADGDLLWLLHHARGLVHLEACGAHAALVVGDDEDLKGRIVVLLKYRGVRSATLVILGDFQVLRQSFGSCSGQDSYSPLADLDADNCVTFNDFRLFLQLLQARQSQ